MMKPQNNNEYFWTNGPSDKNQLLRKFEYFKYIVRFRMLSINLILNEYISVIYKSIDILLIFYSIIGEETRPPNRPKLTHLV